MALKYANLKIILRDVELSNLPAEALAVSPHATVPSLVVSDTEFMDESWDIVKWAANQNDPENWLGENNQYLKDAEMLIEINDFSFKEDLDCYKYADRHPEHSMEYYRQRCEEFIEELNDMLEENKFLLAEHVTIADVAVFSFIRQFAMVDKEWFDRTSYSTVQHWLQVMLATEWFSAAMTEHDTWESDSKNIYL